MSIYFYLVFIIEKLKSFPAISALRLPREPVEMPIAQVFANQTSCCGSIQTLPSALVLRSTNFVDFLRIRNRPLG